MFGETTISQAKVWNHPTETTVLKWMFRVPGVYVKLIKLRWNYRDVQQIWMFK